MALNLLIVPLYLQNAWASVPVNLAVGIILVVLVYLPTCCYFLKEGRLFTSLRSVVMCGLVYGTTDFACLAGVWDCVRGKKRKWIPTNAATQESNAAAVMWEAIFGLVLLLAPLITFPALLYFPCTYVFVGKFLFGPAISLLYRDGITWNEAASKSEMAA
jgi:hypothetical protein